MVIYLEVPLAGIAIVLSALSWKTLRKIKHLDLGKSFWVPVMLSGIFFFTGSVAAILSDLSYSFALSTEFALISRLFALCILLGGVYAYSRQISRNLSGTFLSPTFQSTMETTAETEPSKSIVEESYEKNPAKEANCKHRLGYLKTLPKNTPIPEDCLRCPEIIECKHSYLTKKPTEQGAFFVSFNAESKEETAEI